MADRTQPGVVVIVDLRPPSLLALSKARHHGRPLLVAAVERCVAARVPVIVLVATPRVQQEVMDALGSVAQGCRVGTFEELIAPGAMDDLQLLWLRSLVLDFDDADVARLAMEYAAISDESSVPVVGAIHAALDSAAAVGPLAGWIGSRAEVLQQLEPADGLDRGVRMLPLRIPRSVLVDLDDLAALVRKERRLQAEALMLSGVELTDWASLEIAGELRCSTGVIIGPHVTVEGLVHLEAGVRIGAYTYLRDVKIGANTEIKAFSSLEDTEIGANCRVGPYARLRTRTLIDSGVSIGNFVELKATKVGSGGRINHFAFLGDAVLQADVTIGAGVITCNHDGQSSTATSIEEGAYVGSGSELVAPLTVGRDSTIAAGSTITEDVEPGGLTIARARQVRVADWKRKGGK